MRFLSFCLLLLISCKNEPKTVVKKRGINQQKVVSVQPYEDFSANETKALAAVIDSFYGFKTKILPNIALPKQAFIKVKSPRYRADSLIAIQKRNIPKDVDFVVGLTYEDISVTKHDDDGNVKKPDWKYADFGIMGLAYCPGKSAVISNFRIKNKNKKLEIMRFKKVVIHEFGHNLGLLHCPNLRCVMTSANEKMGNIDNEKLELCGKCKKLIGY